MLKRLLRSWPLRVAVAMAVATAILVPPQLVGAQTPAPTISSIAIISSPDDSASYQAGETIEFSVQFTSNVRVSGSPTLAFSAGDDLRQARFESVRGSEVLFAYSVQSRGIDFDTDGVSIGANALTLGNGDAITDSQGPDAVLTHASVPADAAHRVNMSVVTIEAAGTEPVTEDRSATYIVRRTGSLSRALTVDLDHLLDDNLDNADPAEYSGELPYVHSFRIPRTVTFQSGQDSVRLEIPLNNDAEIEVADGSLTMIVAESADYLVGRPDAATRILQDDNDVPIRVSSARSLGTTVEGPRRLETSLTLQSTRPRDKPPDQLDLSISTRSLTAVVPISEGHSLLDARTGDYVALAKQIRLEPTDWYRSELLVLEGEEFMSWKADISLSTELIDDNVPEPLEQFLFQLERAPATPAGIFASTLLPHISIVTILDDDLAWEIEVLHVDGDTAVGLGEGQTIDTFEDGDESGDLVLDLVATSLYPVGSTAIHSDIHVEMELVGDTEEGLEATYLTDFRRRDESSGTLSTQTVVLSGADITTLEGGRRQTRKRVSIRTVDDTLVEGTEDFRIRLSKTFPDAYVTFTASQFDVRILDNDAPAVSIAADAGSIAEGDDVTFTLTRPAANSTEALPVTLSIVESAEYIDRSGGFVVPTTLTFAAGESTVAVTVPTQDDHVPDGDGTIVATLQPGDGYSYTAVGRSASVDVLEDLPELTLTGVTVSENRSGSVAVSLSQASDEAVSFRWTTADRQGDRAATGGASAGSGVDYRSGSATVEIAAGVTSATIPVRAFNDAIDEHTETFDVVLSNIVGAAAADPRATVSIRDTDDPPQIKVENGTCPNLDDPTDTDTACTEGDDGHMNFDVWLRVARNQGTSGKEVSVGWTASDYAETANTGTAGKARAGSDYVAGSGTLTFPPGVGRLTVQVELLDDEIGENTERFSFRLDDLVNAAQYDSFAYGEILDDGDTGAEEPDTEAPTLSVTDVSVAEGVGTAKVQVQMSRAADRDVSVDYSTADEAPTPSAEAGKDYTATSGTATITAGALSTLIDIPITWDLIYETDETFTVTLSSPVDALLSSDSTATVTILDDDRRPALSVRDTSADEESGPLRFTVERIGASSVAVSANWATADGTATSPTDFTGADGTVTIGPDETTATISVTLAPDDIDESDESLHVTLSNPAEGTILRGTATGTILDNDEAGGGATPRLVVSPTAVSVAEGDSAGASYTVKLASLPGGDVTVSVSGASGSEVTVSPSSLTFTTGNWDTVRTVTVTAGHDDDHADDMVTLTNTAAGGGYSGAAPVAVAVTVADDDSPALVISPTSVTVDEGDTAGLDAGETYTVRLATQPSANVAVTITGTAGTDVSLDTSSMTFTANDWDTAQTVRVTAGHDDDADDDEVTLVHTAAGGGYSSVRGTVAVTVDDDDTARGAGLLIDPTSVEMPEGGGSTYTVRLATEPAQDVAVTVTGTDADLTVLSVQPTVLTFTAADWDTPQTVALAAGTDADTDDDQMTLTHTAASDDTAYDGLSATLAVKVIDDGSTDHAGLEVNPTQLSVDEGGATGYSVRLRSQPSGDVTVTVTVTGAAGSDLEGVPDTLTFTDVDWGVWQSVAMIAYHDPDIDDDMATLTHTADGGSYGGQSADVTVTIVDDDTAGVSLAPTRVTVTEGEGSTTYTAVLDSQPSGDVTVTIGGAGSEVSLDETSLVFTSGNWNMPQTVTVTAVDDDDDEDSETVTLTHTTVSSDDDYDGLAPRLRVTVRDNDTAGVVAPATVTVTEGGVGVGYPVRLASKPTVDVTVTIGGVPHDDITLDNTTLTFTSDNWDIPQTVTVTAVDDDEEEDDETVRLTHNTASTDDDYDDVAVVAITTVTVRDNDTAVAVSFGASSYSVAEGFSVDVTVVLSAAPGRRVEVPLTAMNQGGASGLDYSTPPQTVTFAADQTSVTFAVSAVDDSIDDDGESVLLGFGTPLPDAVSVGSPATATVSITDDETAPTSITLTVSPTSVGEDDGATTVTVTATLGGSVTLPGATDVVVSVGGGTAISGTDYAAVSDFTVTIPKETASGSGTFTLTPTQDAVAEGDETIDVTGAAGGFTVTKAQMTLIDDETAPASITLTVSPTSVSESASGTTVTVTATLGGSATRPGATEVVVSVGGGSATSGTDYAAVSDFTVTIPKETASGTGTFTLTPTNDDIAEGDETIDVTGAAGGFTVTKAQMTLTDDETAPTSITLTVSPTSVGEDDGATTVTVTATLDGSATLLTATEVVVSVGGGSATSGTDYAAVSDFTVTIPKQTASSTGTFTLTPTQDAIAEGDETIDVTGAADGFTVTKAQMTLTDDETAPASITLTVSPTSVGEDDGATTVTVTATLGGSATRPGATEVVVSVGGGSATSGTDYAAVSDFTVTIPKETASGTGTFTLTPTQDAIAEGDETIDVTGTADGFTVTKAQMTLTDDETAPTSITLTVSPTSVGEDDGATTVTVTATLGGSATLPGATDVVVSVGGGTAISGTDYAAVSDFTVTIPKQTASGTGTFTLTPTQDAIAEGDETIDVTGAADGFTVTKAQMTVTDDETAPASITLTVSPTSVSESASGTTVTVTATLGGSATRPGATEVVVSVGGGSATSGTDYAAVSDFTVTIPKETASGTGTFTLTPTNDSLAEGDETIDVTGTAGGFTVTKAQMTLIDDETAPTAITLTTSPTSVGEDDGATTVTVTATLDGSATLLTATDVVVSVGGGSATSGTDYAAVSDFTVTIPKQTASSTGTFTLTPAQDAVAEGDETIDVTGTADGFTVTKAQMTLTDDETAPASITLTVSPTSVSESASGTTVTVTATLGGSATLLTATAVTVSVGGGSATSGTDYAAVSDFTVTIPKQTASGTGTFTLTPTQDAIAEGDETIDVTGTADGFTVTKAQMTLIDDETAPASITLTVSPTSVGEDDGATTVTVTATLGGSATRPGATEVVVSVGGGSATSGTDYAAVSDFTVTIPKETASGTGTFTLTPTNDSLAEGDETIDVTGAAGGFTVTKAQMTLTDDETAPTSITLTVSPTSVGEDDGATTVTVTATLGGSVTLPGATDVVVSVGGGTAISGTDYAAVSDFTVTIPKETASGSGTFTLTPTQDAIAEGDETIDVTGAAGGFTVTKAQMTLTDDETAPASITLTVSPTSVSESASGTTVTVTATLGGSATRPGATEVVVSVGGGSATSGTDYAAVSDFTVTIPKETASGTGTFTLTPTNDDIAEGDETIDVTGAAGGFTVTKAQMTLTDDETAPASITLTVSPTSVSESASGTTVTVTAMLGGSVTLPGATDVVVSVGGGTAISGTDYAAVSDFTVTIPKQTASGTGTFTLTPTQDAIAEGDETIDVTGAAGGFTVTKAQMTLIDDETAPASITLTVSPTSVSESASGTTVTVTATLGGSATLLTATAVTVSVGGGSATSGTDYAAVSDFTVTIPKETASGTGTFTLTPTNDDIAEGDETIDVTGAADGFTVTKAQMTLTDDETAPASITLTVSPTSVSESASGTTVTVTAMLGGSVTLPGATDVVVSVGGGTAISGTDYAAVSDFTVTIPKQTASGSGTFTLTPTQDAIAEGDETIDVTGAAGGFTVTKAQMTLTDDETAPTSITLTVSPTSVGEDDGATTVTVTATLGGSVTLPGATDVVVSVGGGTAISGTDYAAVSDFTVTIPKETASGSGTFTLTPTQDAVAEGDETIDVTGAAGGFTVTKAQMTVTDDETAPASITLTVSPTSVSESASGTTVTVTATLGGSATLLTATEVVVSVGGGSATSGTDYAAVSDFTVTIPKQTASGSGTFTLTPTQDAIAEGDETIDVTGAAGGFTVTKAQMTLIDDETAPASITLTVSPTSVGEDDGATTVTVTATLGGSATRPGATEVVVSVGGGSATSGTDYAAVSDFTVTIPKETASGTGTFTLTPTNDSLAEGDETIDVTGAAGGFTVTKAQMTLTDDETAPTSITLTVSPTSVGEDDGATTVTVTATLGGSVTLPGATDVVVSVGGGTAISGTDYAAVSDFTVTIPKETASGSGTFTLTPTQDAVAEGDETIDVTGAAGGFTVTKAQMTLIDDETAPASITLTVSPTSVSESASGTTVTVTATLGGSATRPGATEVVVSVGGGSATSGTDYAAVSDFTVTIPKETASGTGTFTLTPTNDDIAEGDETIDVTGAAGGFTVTKAQMTLTDDETAPTSITLTVSPTSVSESASGTTVTVTATLGGSVTLLTATDVVVSVGGGSATSGTDYAAVSDFTVTIPKETASGTGTFTLTPTQDAIAEGDETIDVTGTADGFTVTKAQMTLIDDETAPTAITLTVSPTSVGEDDGATTVTVTATLDGSATLPGATDVVVSVGGGSATSGTDYAAVSDFTVTIPKETASGSGTFTLTPTNDSLAEGDETIDVTGAAGGFTVTKAQMTLTDDETAPTSITLTVSPTSVGEDDGATTVTVTATLGGSVTLPGATDVVVSVGGGTAISGTDYAAVSDFTVTIPKQTASGSGTFTLTPTQDAIAEGDETIDVTGTAGGFTVTKAQMTVTDDETAPASITLTVSPTSVSESASGTTVTVTATLDGSATLLTATDVVVSVGGGSATSGTDYAAVSDFTVTIPKETASGTGTFTLTPTNDSLAEGDETIDVTGTAGGFTVTKAQMTLIDDETAPTAITLTTSPTSVGEDDGATTVTVTATLDGSATLLTATDVVVSVGGGSATSGTDYAAVSDFTVTIPKQTASSTGTFTLTPTNDAIAEGDETIDVTGTADGFTVTKAQMTLTNDDPSVTVEFEKAEHLTREGASRAGVALTLSAAPQAETRIEIRVESGSTASTSDYLISKVPGYEADDDDYFPLGVGETFEVTFAKDETLASFGVKPIPDLLDEGEEQIVFGFGTLPSGIGEGSLSKATVTILDSDREEDEDDDDDDDDDGDDDDGDDDDGDDRVCQRGVDGEAMFEVSAESRHVPRDRTMPRVMIAEGDNGRGIAGEQATLTVSTVAGATCSRDQTFTLDLAGTAVLGHDYSISPRTLTLPAGETSVSAAVTALDDRDDLEPTDTVKITVRHQGEKIGQETVWISPCDGAGRGWAFSWLTVEEMRRAHPKPSNVTSPFTLRVCFSEPVNHVRIINDEYDEYLASLIIASHEVRPPNEARRPYVTGTLSNLREIQPGQIWLVDVTADETGYFALTLLGSRYAPLDGDRDTTYDHAYSHIWVTVPRQP